MTDKNEACPKCNSTYSYLDGQVWVCPECFHEWSVNVKVPNEENINQHKFLDANGNPLSSGDNVTLIKDLKLGGDTLKSGTKVKNIRLLDDPQDDHDISCKISGHGSVYLKSSVVKKSK